MKNKNNCEMPKSVAVMILAFLFVLMLYLLINYNYNFNLPKDKFTITKEVCEEKIKQTEDLTYLENGREYFIYTFELEPYESESIDFYEERMAFFYGGSQYDDNFKTVYSFPRIKKIVSAIYFDWNDGLEKNTYSILDERGRPIFKNNFFTAYRIENPTEFFVDITFQFRVFYDKYSYKILNEIETICTQVEVDEIEYEVTETFYVREKVPECFNLNEIINLDKKDMLTTLCIECEGWCVYRGISEWDETKVNKIPKQNLTRESLDENAECSDTNYREYNERCYKSEERDVNLRLICSQWKSFLENFECSKYEIGDYTIEITK